MSGTDHTSSPPGTDPATPISAQTERLIEVTLDPNSIARSISPNIDHEREVAIYDLLDANQFGLSGRTEGPYRLALGTQDDRLVFDIRNEAGQPLIVHMLSFTPLRRAIKDYFIVCETYYNAIKTAPPSRIQAVDMGRRSLHDEGARIVQARLDGKIVLDHDTARRLFTLICALHAKT